MNKIDTFKNRLTIAMSLSGKRPVDICQETGIKKSAFSQYASGKIEPKTDRIYLLANALNVQEAWLMGYDVPMERKQRLVNSLIAEQDIQILSDIDSLSNEDKQLVLNLIASLKAKSGL